MSDLDNTIPGDEGFNEQPANETPPPSFDAAFEAMSASLDGVPGGEFIILRHEANEPMYIQLFEGEAGLTVRQAAERRHLTFGASVNIYIDGNPAMLDTFCAPGTVVTLVGNVKGG